MQVTAISMPALTSVVGDLNIDTAHQLIRMQFPALTAVGGFLRVDQANSLSVQ